MVPEKKRVVCCLFIFASRKSTIRFTNDKPSKGVYYIGNTAQVILYFDFVYSVK